MTSKIKQNIYNETKEMIMALMKEHLQKIVLYGSYARNDEDNESDIDFFILTDLNKRDIKKLHDKIVDTSVELSLKYDTLFSFLLVNLSHFNKYSEVIPLFKNIINEGIVLYER